MGSSSLEGYRVGAQVINSLYYIPDYINSDEEERLLREIRASKQQWKTVHGRRLQNLGGIVHKKGLIPAQLPRWLQPVLHRLAATGIYGEGEIPNHTLINAYLPGQGILPHQDGPLYHEAVAILSLGAPAVLRFARKCSEASADADAAAHDEPDICSHQLVASVACMPRSLLIFRDEAYTSCLHGILETATESIDDSVVNAEQAGLENGQRLPRGTERISLTVRRVLHSYSLSIRL